MSEDFVEITLKVPKLVVEFFRGQTANLEEFLVRELVNLCESWIDGVIPKMIAARYPGLKDTFKIYGFDVNHL